MSQVGAGLLTMRLVYRPGPCWSGSITEEKYSYWCFGFLLHHCYGHIDCCLKTFEITIRFWSNLRFPKKSILFDYDNSNTTYYCNCLRNDHCYFNQNIWGDKFAVVDAGNF